MSYASYEYDFVVRIAVEDDPHAPHLSAAIRPELGVESGFDELLERQASLNSSQVGFSGVKVHYLPHNTVVNAFYEPYDPISNEVARHSIKGIFERCLNPGNLLYVSVEFVDEQDGDL